MSWSRCARCGSITEPPVGVADGICGAFIEVLGPCCPPDRPLCTDCVEIHIREISAALTSRFSSLDNGDEDDAQVEVQTTDEPFDPAAPQNGDL